MRSSYAILHDVEDASQWPFPVKQFAELLNQPLPAYIATGPYPFVSTRASDLVRELAQSTSQPIEQDASSDCLRSSPLANVFDTVLSTVFELRDLAKIKGYGFPCPTVPLWSSLIQSLAFAVSEDLCVLLVCFSLTHNRILKSHIPTGVKCLLSCPVAVYRTPKRMDRRMALQRFSYRAS